MSTHNKIIFIVDDDEIYATSLKLFINAHFPDIKETKIFSIGEMCLMELHRNPIVVIVDYRLNSVYKEAHNGLEIIKHIKSEKPKTNIILLSAQKNYHVALEVMSQQDCSYIQKNKDAFRKVDQLIKKIFNRKPFPALQPWT